MSDFADRLNIILKLSGGAKALARKSGVSLRTIQSYKAAGNFTKRTTAQALAVAAGVSPDWLISGVGEPFPNSGGNDHALNSAQAEPSPILESKDRPHSPFCFDDRRLRALERRVMYKEMLVLLTAGFALAVTLCVMAILLITGGRP